MKQRRSIYVLVSLLLFTGPAPAQRQLEGSGHFENADFSIFWQQRMIDEVIVEKDYLVLQYDRDTRNLLKRTVHHRDNLPASFSVKFSRGEAEALAGGMTLSSNLYLIAPDSDVFPLDVIPQDPCWVVRTKLHDRIVVTIIDAETGTMLGYGVPPPGSSLSISGPMYSSPCSGSWEAWYTNAQNWFDVMGYACQGIVWPTRPDVSSHIADVSTILFYEIAHGGSYSFASGCEGGESFELITVADIETWISPYTKMPFSFLANCGAMCDTGFGSISHALRKGSDTRAVTVGYCGMADEECDLCWTYSVDWQNALFSYIAEGWTVKDAYDQALADYPMCQECVGFAGDESFAGPFSRAVLPPEGFLCAVESANAFLEWSNSDDYEEIDIYRNQELIASLDGVENTYCDILTHPGHFVYDLSGRIGVVESVFSSCAVDAGFRSRTGRVIESGTWGWSRNVGEKVNSSYSDGSPELTNDGTKLYFHSNHRGGLGGHDIYMSLRDGEEWHPPVNLGLPVNSQSHEFSPSVSASGDSLYFASDRPGSLGKCDIWLTVKIQGCCSVPVNLGPVVNSIYDERSPEISNDGMTLFFESDRPGGFGETDIWFCEWNGSGWSSPVNAGPRINTPSFEKNPSLSGSDQVLCFDSNKPGGAGLADIYVSIREGSGWKVAQNLGWHVNSSSADAEPTMSPDGLILLFSSTRPGGFGMNDIFIADSAPDRNSDHGHEFIVPGIVKPLDTGHQIIP